MRYIRNLAVCAVLAFCPALSYAQPVPGGAIMPYSPPPSSVGVAAPGQVPGSATNDTANAGNVGEILNALTPGTTATVTISIASPAVISWSGNTLTVGGAVQFSTNGALPTGISAATTYYVIAAGFSAGVSFEISATPGGTAIITTGTQSGTQTANTAIPLTNNGNVNIAAVNLTAGTWDVDGWATLTGGATTVWAYFFSNITPTSGTINLSGTNDFSSTVPAAGFQSVTGSWTATTGPVRYNVATSQIVYLMCIVGFSTSTASCAGQLRATRVR